MLETTALMKQLVHMPNKLFHKCEGFPRSWIFFTSADNFHKSEYFPQVQRICTSVEIFCKCKKFSESKRFSLIKEGYKIHYIT